MHVRAYPGCCMGQDITEHPFCNFSIPLIVRKTDRKGRCGARAKRRDGFSWRRNCPRVVGGYLARAPPCAGAFPHDPSRGPGGDPGRGGTAADGPADPPGIDARPFEGCSVRKPVGGGFPGRRGVSGVHGIRDIPGEEAGTVRGGWRTALSQERSHGERPQPAPVPVLADRRGPHDPQGVEDEPGRRRAVRRRVHGVPCGLQGGVGGSRRQVGASAERKKPPIPHAGSWVAAPSVRGPSVCGRPALARGAPEPDGKSSVATGGGLCTSRRRWRGH